MPPTLQQATTNPRLCQRLPDTHRQVSCGVTVPFSWVLVHKVLLCPPRVYFPVLCKFWQLYSGVNGDLQQEDLYHTHIQSPWKRSVFIRIPKKGNTKECSIYHTIALISHTSKEQYVNCELPDVQDGFRKGRETRDQIAHIHWIIKKESSRKNIYFCFIDYAKAFDCVDPKQTVERDGNTRPPDLPLEISVCRSGSNS